ncbi:ATP-grasp domain-containing protein [Microbacterium sp.]|uniref:ATP-grasp domain-containing protein n=1 Tax=Microbacterium sp. TaxID=51671 RepID=UPI003F9C3B4A
MPNSNTRNIFVLGLDDVNRSVLESMPDADRYTFHQLLRQEELQQGVVSVPDLLGRARNQLDAFDGQVDAIVGYWDFPSTMMVPILCRERGLRSASLEAVVKCEHKYWSRLEQEKVIDEHPAFALLDLSRNDITLPDGLDYPVWIKPIKSASSEGAHYVEDDEHLKAAAAEERDQIGRMGGPFNDILEMLDLPLEIAEIGPDTCLVEGAATGFQVTVEGYAHDGQIEVYGVVDSVTYPDTPSFLRYEYPSSRVPQHIQNYMAEVSRRVISAVDLTNSTFNIEYFWDPETESLNLLEVNARHSQSHAPLFAMVDSIPNHAFMLDLALGRDPRDLPRRQGAFMTAAKWLLRTFSDGVVRRVPTAQEIAALEEEFPGTTIDVTVAEGQRLSEGEGEDSYSYLLAEVFLGARNGIELTTRWDRCVEALQFEIDPVEEIDPTEEGD